MKLSPVFWPTGKEPKNADAQRPFKTSALRNSRPAYSPTHWGGLWIRRQGVSPASTFRSTQLLHGAVHPLIASVLAMWRASSSVSTSATLLFASGHRRLQGSTARRPYLSKEMRE